MKDFFYPNSLAVIGVSPAPNNLGLVVLANLRRFGFSGEVYPVGRKGGELDGQRIFRHLRDLPTTPDLALILTPAPTVPQLVETCGELGIRRVVISSGGFSELDPERRNLEERILRATSRWGIRVIGPNGLGLINLEVGLVLPFVALDSKLHLGGASVLAQSGGVGIEYINYLTHEGLGLNKFVSLGNKLDVDETELLAYLVEDPGTEFVFLYLEDVRDGRRLVELARRTDKPVIVQMANLFPMTRSAARSHTAALAPDPLVLRSALDQGGLIWAEDPYQAVQLAKIFRLPPMRGRRLAIISRSGGHAVVATDRAAQQGFELPDFDPGVIEQVRQISRAGVIRLQNPLDLGDVFDLPAYARIVREALQKNYVDGVLLIHTFTASTEEEATGGLLRELEEGLKGATKPVAVCLSAEMEALERLAQESALPLFFNLGLAIQALAASYRFWLQDQKTRPFPEPLPLPSEVLSRIEGWCQLGVQPMAFQAMELLEELGIPFAPWKLVRSSKELEGVYSTLNLPLVLKVMSPQILHKWDVGGVRLNLTDLEETREAFSAMQEECQAEVPTARIEGILVQEMVPEGQEFIVGAKRDPHFGPLVLVGFGGLFTELFGDVAIRLAPVDEQQVQQMLGQLKGAPLLDGFRGQRPLDREALSRVIVVISHLIAQDTPLQEVEINPLKVFAQGKGCLALDARAIIHKP